MLHQNLHEPQLWSLTVGRRDWCWWTRTSISSDRPDMPWCSQQRNLFSCWGSSEITVSWGRLSVEMWRRCWSGELVLSLHGQWEGLGVIRWSRHMQEQAMKKLWESTHKGRCQSILIHIAAFRVNSDASYCWRMDSKQVVRVKNGEGKHISLQSWLISVVFLRERKFGCIVDVEFELKMLFMEVWNMCWFTSIYKKKNLQKLAWVLEKIFYLILTRKS